MSRAGSGKLEEGKKVETYTLVSTSASTTAAAAAAGALAFIPRTGTGTGARGGGGGIARVSALAAEPRRVVARTTHGSRQTGVVVGGVYLKDRPSVGSVAVCLSAVWVDGQKA